MEFQNLKRKELQALCKKHKIPANLSNLDMASKLTALFKEIEKSSTQGRIIGRDESVTETEFNSVVSNRKVKKVRFSPDHQVIEFTRSQGNKRRIRKKSLLSVDTNLSVENDSDVDVARLKPTNNRGRKSDKTNQQNTSSNGELRLRGEILMNEGKRGRKNVKGDDNKALIVVDDDKSIPDRVTRSGGHNLVEASRKEEKRGNKVVNSNDDMHSLVSIENDENRVVTRRSFRNKGVVDEGKLTVGFGANVNDNCEGRKEVSKEKKIAEEKVTVKPQILVRRSKRKPNDNCEKREEVMKEREIAEEKVIVEPQIMVRRSKRKAYNNCEEREEVMEDKKLAEAKVIVEPQILVRRSKRKANNHCEEREEVVKEKEIAKEKVTVEPQILVRRSKRKGNDNCEEREEVLEDKKTAQDKVIVEPQVLLRRSKRKVNTVDDTETLIGDVQKHENGGIKGLRKTRKSLAFKGLGVDAKNTENKVVPDGKLEAVFQNQEPMKVELRRSGRTSVMPAHGNLGNDGRYALSTSVLQEEIANGVSEVDKKDPQPGGVLRRSRRNILKLELVYTDAAVGNFETAKLSSDPCLVKREIPVVQRSTRTSKRNASIYTFPQISDEFAGDSIIQLENEKMNSKKKASSRKNVLNDDSGPLAQSMSKASRSENAPSVYDMSKVADGKKPSSILSGLSLLEASPQEGLLAIEESLSAQLSVTEAAENIRNAALSMNTGRKTINTDMRLTSSTKSIRKIQDSSIADGAGTPDMESINGIPLSNFDENATLITSELRINSADCNKEISDRVVDKVHLSLEVDVQESLEKTIRVIKNEVPALVFSQIEDSSCHNMIDSNELPEGLNVSENEGIAENSSSVDSLILCDQTDFKTDMKVTEDDAEKCAQPCLDFVNLVGEVKGVSSQENLDPAESSQENLDPAEPQCMSGIVLPIQCHPDDVDLSEASKKTYEKSNTNSALEAGEISAFKPCEGDIASTDSESPLEIKAPSSGELRRGLEDGYIVQGDKSYIYQTVALDRSNEGECLGEHNGASDEDSEFPPQVRENFGESTKDSYQQELFSESTGVNPSITFGCSESSEIKLRDLEAGHIAKADGSCIHKGVHPELDKSDEGGCLENKKSTNDEDRKFDNSNLFDKERFVDITPQDRDFSGECSTKDFDEQEVFHESANCSKMKLRSGLEADDIDEDEKTYALAGVDPELAKSDDGRCLHDHKGASDLDKEIADADLCIETHSGVSPQSGETFVSEYLNKDPHDQVMSHASPAVSPTIKYSEGFVTNVFDMCRTSEKEAGVADITEKIEAEAVQSKMPGDNMPMDKTFSCEELEIFDKAEESSYKITYEPEEQPKTPLFETIANTFQLKKSSSCGNLTAGNALSIFKTSNSQGEIACWTVEKSNTDENEILVQNSIVTLANNGRCGKVKEDFIDAQTADATVCRDDTISKVESDGPVERKHLDMKEIENQCQKLLEGNIMSNLGKELSDDELGQSWKENEPSNLFGTPELSIITPSGPNEASSRGPKISNLMTSFNKSIARRDNCSFTQKKQHKIDGERGSEYEKVINESLLLTHTYQEVSGTVSIVGKEGPIKIEASCKVDELSGFERNSESTFCREGMFKMNKVVIQPKSHEEVGEAGNELVNASPGNSVLPNCEGASYKYLDLAMDVEGANLNASPFLPVAKDVLIESSEEKCAEITCGRMKGTSSISEENIFSLGQSILDEETKDSDSKVRCHNSSLDADLPENLNDGNRAYVKPEGKIAQKNEVAFGISAADIPMCPFPTNCEDSNSLKETLIDAFGRPPNGEVAKVGSISGEIDVVMMDKDETTERKYAQTADAAVSMDDAICHVGSEIPSEPKLLDSEETENQCQKLLKGNIISNVREEISDEESGQSWQENEFSNLFGTLEHSLTPSGPNEASSRGTEISSFMTSLNKGHCSFTEKKQHEIDGISGFERKLESTSCTEGVPRIKKEVLIQTKCPEEVGEAGNETYTVSLENSVLPDRKGPSEEILNLVKDVEVVNLNTSPIFPVAKYVPTEAFEEKCAEMTCEPMKGTCSISENNDLSLGQTFLDEDATASDSESAEKKHSVASSPSNLDEVGCDNKLFNTDLSEKLTYGSRLYVKSKGKMAQNSEVAFGVSAADSPKLATPEKNISFTANCEDSNYVRESLIDAFVEPLNSEVAKVGSIDGEIDVLMMDKGTLLRPSSEEETTERKHERDDGNSYDAKGLDDTDDKIRSSHEMNDELQTNIKVEVRSYSEADMLAGNNEKQSTVEETKETRVTFQNAAEDGSTFSHAESDLFTSLEMQLFKEHDNNDNGNSEAEPYTFNLEGDHEKDGRDAEGNSVDMLELHLQEKVEDFSNDDTLTFSNLPSSQCDEILKESDVMETIKEYIDSESSLSVDFDDSGCASLPFDVAAHIEEGDNNDNAAFSKPLETENKELVLHEGCAASISMASGKEIDTEDRHSTASRLFSTAKKNARTILIHGTPGKSLKVADMKENAPKSKTSQRGNFTTVRPAKRKALQDVRWK